MVPKQNKLYQQITCPKHGKLTTHYKLEQPRRIEGSLSSWACLECWDSEQDKRDYEKEKGA